MIYYKVLYLQYIMSKTALITGSEGFIGNYLTRLLLLKNYNVIGGYYKKKK